MVGNIRPRNALLGRLTSEDLAQLAPHLVEVPLKTGDVIFAPGQRLDQLYFPEGGIVSMHSLLEDGQRIGVGIIGFEGLAGWPVLLGSRSAVHEATIAIGGSALAVPAPNLLSIVRERRAINELLLLYVQCFMHQMAGTILSNVHDPIDRRLARWLLMNQDRLGGEEIKLTHDQLGVMLDVRRASVTDAVHILEGEGLIRSVRGRITIRNRPGLVIRAGEAYGSAEKTYAELIGTLPRA